MTMEPMLDVTPFTLSDQLVADDLLPGPIIVEILSISVEETSDKPVIIEIDSIHPPWKPCKTSRRLMMHGWGRNMFKWVGKSVELYRDPTVTYGTEEVGGVQIGRMSHMSEPLVVKLIVGRNNKKRLFRIPVLELEPPPSTEDVLKRIGLTVDAVDAWRAGKGKGPIGGLSDDEEAAFVGWFAANTKAVEEARALMVPAE